MRLLFVSFPGLGHFFPLVPFAWAAQAAGHEVFFATTGPGLDAAQTAGLAAIEAAPGFDPLVTMQQMGKEATAKGLTMAERAPLVVAAMAKVNDAMADVVVEAAKRFKPHAIVASPVTACASIAAAVIGVPLVVHGLGITIGGRSELEKNIPTHMGAAMQRFGVKEAAKVAIHLDTAPPSMATSALERAWPMRAIAYNGGAVVPSWVHTAGAGERVCITLGSVVPKVAGLGVVSALVEAARGHEVVLALGDVDVSALGALPEGVRVAGWLPFSVLAPTCHAIVHHGGSGTTMNALSAGTTQVVVPHMADQPQNAAAVTKRGVGLGLELEHATADAAGAALKRVLDERSFQNAAAEVKAEIAAMPSPAVVVERLARELGA